MDSGTELKYTHLLGEETYTRLRGGEIGVTGKEVRIGERRRHRGRDLTTT